MWDSEQIKLKYCRPIRSDWYQGISRSRYIKKKSVPEI